MHARHQRLLLPVTIASWTAAGTVGYAGLHTQRHLLTVVGVLIAAAAARWTHMLQHRAACARVAHVAQRLGVVLVVVARRDDDSVDVFAHLPHGITRATVCEVAGRWELTVAGTVISCIDPPPPDTVLSVMDELLPRTLGSSSRQSRSTT